MSSQILYLDIEFLAKGMSSQILYLDIESLAKGMSITFGSLTHPDFVWELDILDMLRSPRFQPHIVHWQGRLRFYHEPGIHRGQEIYHADGEMQEDVGDDRGGRKPTERNWA
jgi:hypothetical protein